jgi:hypothetical protein
MKFRLLMAATLAAATGSVTFGASAQSQPWLRDRRYGEGIGIRAGNLELHPSLAGEFGYDSNYFQRSGNTADDAYVDEPVISAFRLRFTPSVSVTTLGAQRRAADLPGAEPPKVNFTGQVSASYNELFATDSQYKDQVSQQRNLAANAGFNLDILPSKPWGAELYGDFQRTVEGSNDPNDKVGWNRDSLRLGAMLAWRPGGGLFDWRLGYELRYNFFESSSFSNLNNIQHYVKTKGNWRFLPRTALVYDAELGWVRYGTNNGYLNDSSPVRTRLGLTGLITNHFGILAMAGWGASFYTGNNNVTQDFDSLIAQAEVKWYIVPQQNLPQDAAQVGLSSVAVGYTRDFQNSYLTDYYQRDRVYGKFEYFFAGVAVLSFEAGYGYYGYPTSFFPRAAGAAPVQRYPGFNESRVDASVFGEYRLSNTFGLNTTLRYDANLTDVALPIIAAAPATPNSQDQLKFSRFQAFIGARWFM